jgi:hypothetical protein
MAKKLVAIKDLNASFVNRPRCDLYRYENKMKLDTVSDADRSELEQTLLENLNYRVHVCTLPFHR